ncbi:MAG: LamB/YcsF family protein, partial [Sphingorhabdus sp.]
MPQVSSANVACGYHAGDPVIMDRTIRLAKDHGVDLGAHI